MTYPPNNLVFITQDKEDKVASHPARGALAQRRIKSPSPVVVILTLWLFHCRPVGQIWNWLPFFLTNPIYSLWCFPCHLEWGDAPYLSSPRLQSVLSFLWLVLKKELQLISMGSSISESQSGTQELIGTWPDCCFPELVHTKQDFTLLLRLAWNSLCSPGYLQVCTSPAWTPECWDYTCGPPCPVQACSLKMKIPHLFLLTVSVQTAQLLCWLVLFQLDTSYSHLEGGNPSWENTSIRSRYKAFF